MSLRLSPTATDAEDTQEGDSLMVEVQNQPASLADLVDRFQVCWEVWPEQIIVDKERRQIGFCLELSGTHEMTAGQGHSECPECLHVFASLHEIAKAILPKEQRPSVYYVGSYDRAIRYTPVRGNRPDITLTIKILHRESFERPVDACEVRCLEEMKQRLRELGACERQWTSRKEHQR